MKRRGGWGLRFFAALQWTLLVLSGNDENLPTRFFVCGDSAAHAHLQSEDWRATSTLRCIRLWILRCPRLRKMTVRHKLRLRHVWAWDSARLSLERCWVINLRCGEFSPRAQHDALRHEWRQLGRLAAAVAVAAGLAVGMDLYSLNSRYQLLRQEVRRVFAAALPEVQTVVNEKAQLEEAIATLQQRRRLLRGVGTVSPLEVLRHLSAALPEQVPLDLEEWSFDDDAVRLRGSTSSFEAAETIKTAVTSLGIFREVQLKDVKTETGSQKVVFGLQMLLKQENQNPAASEPTADTGTL